MENKVFRKLQNKFFYTPLIIGWVLVLLACSLIFYITYEKTMSKVQSDLLKANDAPYFQSDNLIYIFNKNGSYTSSHIENAYSKDEIENIKEFLSKDKKDNKFISESGKYFMFVQSSSVDDDITTIKYVIIEYTDDMETLLALAITLTVIAVAAMIGIFLFCYFYSRNAIAPVKASFIQQQELVANASHELKTPLTIIRTNLDLIQSDENATIKDNAKWLESTNEQVNRMNTLILDMLELSRLDASKNHRMREQISLNDYLQGTILSFEAPCYEKNIALDFIADENLSIMASVEELEKLSTILLDNAIKYTPDNGKITVKLQKARQRRQAILSFTNTGEGIPSEHLDRIFERFYKVDPSHKETHNSFGLGLSIAKSIVVSLGGSIRCESKLGEYTSFIIELPLAQKSLSQQNNDR